MTPDLAQSILSGNIKNRPLNNRTVADYADQMRSGKWKLNGEPIIVGRSGTLLDGQHRLQAVVAAQTSVPMLVIYNIDDSSFTTINTGRIRTAGDIFAIDGIGNSTKKAASITAYFNMLRNSVTPNNMLNTRSLRDIRVSKADILDFYHKHTELVDTLVALAQRCDKKLRLLSQSQIVAYSLYLVLNKNHPVETVMNFFDQLHQVTKETNSTLAQLRVILIKHNMKQVIISNDAKHAYIVHAWNAFIKGKELSVLRYNSKKDNKPEFI